MVRFSYTPMEWASTNFYKPSKEDTKLEFEKLRCFVEHRLGEFRPVVVLGVTDIVLWILKCDDHFITPIHKRAELEKLLNPIEDQVFEQMLLITQRITDYSIQDSDQQRSTHPYRAEFHNNHPLTSMENIVAYNLLIRAYQDGPWSRPPPQIVHRKKAFEMLLILNNQSVKPIETQRETIGNFLYGVSDHIYRDLLVFIISKLFPKFVLRWDNVVFSARPATIYIDSRVPSSSIDEKVIDTLGIFTWIVLESLRFWNDDGEGADKEEDNGGFEESENELGSVGASAPRDVPDHHQRSRKGNGDRSAVETKPSHGKHHVEKKNRGNVV